MKPAKTYLGIVMDRSGSMANLANEASMGINTFIMEQKKVVGKCHITFVEFDTMSTDFLARNKDLKDFSLIYKMNARGGTPLCDALGKTIVAAEEDMTKVRKAKRAKFDKVIIVIWTDGYENASREYTRESVKAKIESHPEWEFIFMGAGIDAFAEAQALGINYNTTMSTSGTAGGYRGQTQSLSSYTTRSRAGGQSVFTQEEREQGAQQ